MAANLRSLISTKKSGIIASLITLAVITLLILAGPAAAFNVSLGAFSDDNAKQGDLISAQFDLNMNSNERVAVDAIVLSSDKGLNCAVDVDGDPLPMYDCEGIIIERLSSSTASYGYDYSYGYGYGYGYAGSPSKLSYNVTVNTSILAIGENELTLTANSESASKTILVSSQGDAVAVTTLILGGDFTFFESEELNASINITFEDGSTGKGSITVEQYSEKPANVDSFYLPGLNTYLVINDDNLDSALSNETELRIYYTDAEVAAAGIDESTLKLYYWNATSDSWESPLSSGVNTVDNYVWAKTNHFSSWGMFGNSKSSSSSGTSSSNSGYCDTTWTCSEWSACNNGQQTRYCSYPTNFCAPTNVKPLEAQACAVTPANTNNANTQTNETTPAQTQTSTGFNFLTGNVIGNLGSPAGIAFIVVIVLVVAGLIIVLIRRRKAASSNGKKKKETKVSNKDVELVD